MSENCNLLLSDFLYKQNLRIKNLFKNYHYFFKKKNIFSVSIDDPRQHVYSEISFIPNSVKKNSIKKDKTSKAFTGTKFICFNKDLIKTKKNIKHYSKNILIFIGGNDKKNYSIKILRSILKLKLPLNIKIILNNKQGILNTKNLMKKNTNIHLLKNTSNMNSLLNWSDIFIGGEGLSKFEAAVKGVPYIFINNVENNKKDLHIINLFLKFQTSLFFKVEYFDSKRFNLLFLKLFKNIDLRKKFSKNGLKLFDLDGAKRMYKIINDLYKKFLIYNH